MLNQARKRARLAQKFEETKTIITNEFANDTNNDVASASETKEDFSDATLSNERDRKENEKNITFGVESGDPTTSSDVSVDKSNDNKENRASNDVDGDPDNDDDSLIINNIPPPANNLEDRIKKFLKSKVKEKNSSTEQEFAPVENGCEKSIDEPYVDDEVTEHLHPTQVDTTEVLGEIVQVSNDKLIDKNHPEQVSSF